MPVKHYPQLPEHLRALLERQVEALGSKAAVAAQLGVGRTAIVQAINGRYPSDARHLAAKIEARFVDAVICPALGREIAPADCAGYRARPLAACTASRETVRHWQACQGCGHNPARPKAAAS